MMELLVATPPSELPEEALLARLRSRRATLGEMQTTDGDRVSADVSTWLYRHLNRRLRRQLAPLFELQAMRSLTLALRYRFGGEQPPQAILQGSLLAMPLQQALAAKEPAQATIARLEAAMAARYPFARGLSETERRQGPGGCEQQLVAGLLQQGRRSAAPVVAQSLSYMIDMRNCLSVQKLWRWRLDLAPPLIDGGGIDLKRLQRIAAQQDHERFAMLVASLTGSEAASDKPLRLEQHLLNGLTRQLKRWGRDPLGLGVVIDYLWRAQ
ncbi:MAG: V-type ATPase subunit, partial [Desulfuromonadales bacterium]|nr:V-type ATPase subunit [Desulfuromonadales bacterium]